MEAQLLSPHSLLLESRWITVSTLQAFEYLKLEGADYAHRAVLRPFAGAFAPGFGFMVAGTELESFLEVPVRCLGEVADPAPASALRTGRGGHQSPIPSSTAGPRPSSGW